MSKIKNNLTDLSNKNIKIEGYIGICGICFEPIKEGEEVKFREKSVSYFHRNCATLNPNSYYLALEKIRGQFEKGENPTELMNDMERIFKIKILTDERFNEENQEVIKLYREISDSREL